MNAPYDDDPVWDTAWAWAQREFDRETFDAAARAEMTAWLLKDPLHRQRYEEAAHLWLLAGMVPRRSGNPTSGEEREDA
ncbi:DUF4880 domain-containing protein [Acidovorax sp. NCPPB 4044]|uniref:DUF4880 domain-containing protein n=1 Tax=Acidovorax sp. NCPPB 4044 TaxID=2940490 RepID=UPI00230220D1|nr:DUF4880 domain-containing protein [Acidovorax sp. NCPPB 4044]MDA8522150.1 DUF4880 domain-containing protein [Acidovorax sp. NCPPB 4044]